MLHHDSAPSAGRRRALALASAPAGERLGSGWGTAGERLGSSWGAAGERLVGSGSWQHTFYRERERGESEESEQGERGGGYLVPGVVGDGVLQLALARRVLQNEFVAAADAARLLHADLVAS